MSAASVLYNDLYLQISNEKFYIFSSSHERRRVLAIDRVTHDISLEESNSGFIPAEIQTRHSICGIIGIIQLVSGPALIVAKSGKKVGDLTSSNHGIYELAASELYPFARSDHHLTPGQQEENTTFTQMIKGVLDTPSFYFSNSTDLSNSFQRKHSFHNESLASADSTTTAVSIFTKWDRRFVWNRNLLSRFLERGADFLPYCLPLIHGAVFIRRCSRNGKLFRYGIISRKSVHHAGTRFFTRGIDDFGNCANFVETEQVIETGNALAAFVQTRGSIPMYWSQTPNVIDYKPDPVVSSTKTHVDAFVKHFTEQIGLYGYQVMLNLIDHKKAEGVLEQHVRALNHSVALSNIEYKAFDFHKECANLNWSKLGNLIRDLVPHLQRFNFFLVREGNVDEKQGGVIRTNCIDCLDRTNVVQSMISEWFLQSVLHRLGILLEGQSLGKIESFQLIFRNIWADHADKLSVQYSGTGALKTDFTRTGKRTIGGLWEDLKNSLLRYYKNNFADGFRQDAIDLFLGNYTKGSSSMSYYASVPKITKTSILIPLFAISLAILLLTLLASSEYDFSVIMFILFWISVTIVTAIAIYKNAIHLVDFPKLRKVN